MPGGGVGGREACECHTHRNHSPVLSTAGLRNELGKSLLKKMPS